MALITSTAAFANAAGPISIGWPVDANLVGREIVALQIAGSSGVAMHLSVAGAKYDSGALFTYTVTPDSGVTGGFLQEIPPASVIPSAASLTTITASFSGAATGTAFVFYNPIFKTAGTT